MNGCRSGDGQRHGTTGNAAEGVPYSSCPRRATRTPLAPPPPLAARPILSQANAHAPRSSHVFRRTVTQLPVDAPTTCPSAACATSGHATRPRQRPENVKQQVVEAREFEDIRLVKEHVAEFRYRPVKCKRAYRVVVVWKELDIYQGQKKLFDDARCFFYITNDEEKSAEAIVFDANDRCNQENLLAQLKGGVRSLTAPVDGLLSNWAYMVMASLAWSLKAWAALILPEMGRWQKMHREDKRRLLQMDFGTFRAAIMRIPAQIVTTGRRIVYRLLRWNPWQHVFFRLLDQLGRPLRC